MKNKKIIKRFFAILGICAVIYVVYNAFDIWTYSNVDETNKAETRSIPMHSQLVVIQ